MRVTVTFSPSQFRSSIMSPLSGQARRRILGVMAAKFKHITRMNFGAMGIDRPNPWAPLSLRYAKQVKRPHATLDLTGELFRSIQMNVNDDMAEVFTESDYGDAHQFGNGRLPARGFMPMFRGRFTNYAQRECLDAARKELELIFRGVVPSAVY